MTLLRTCLIAAAILALNSAAHAADDATTDKNPRIAAIVKSLSAVKPISATALSPDGRQLAVIADGGLMLGSTANPASGKVPALCGSAKLNSVDSPAWSPDGAKLALLATCGDELGIYLVAGGKAHKLTVLHGFAHQLAWSPDGRSIGLLYVEGATRAAGALAAMKPPSGVIGVEGLEIQRVATVDAATGKLTEATLAGLHVYEFDWSPDSAKLAFIAAPPPGENNWWVAKLYTQSLGAEPKAILDPVTVEGPLHGLQIAVPRWSPDGKEIAFIGGLMSDQGATGGDIYLLKADGGEPRKLDKDLQPKGSVAWIDWDAKNLLTVAFIQSGKAGLTQVDMSSHESSASISKRTVLFPGTFGDGRLELSVSEAATGHFAFVLSTLARAPEVWEGALGDSGESSTDFHAITNLNASLKPAWGKAESVEWTNDNFHVQGWLLYPADYDPTKKYPLIVMVHGGPSSAVVPRWPRAGFGAAPFSAAGFFVLEPNPRGSYGEGEAFTQANRKDFGYGDLRDILAGVDAVEKQIPAVDDHRLGLTGWSYGGFMTMFGVTQTQRFRAAVAGAGISDWLSYYGENSIDQWMTPFFGASVYDDPAIYAKSSAINYIKQVKTPTLIVVGDRDGECPAPQSFEFWHALKAQGVDTRLIVYPDEGHGFQSEAHRVDVLERAISWFDTHLNAEQAGSTGR
jgi:dipeptidyl aminopeptidase/acylaminoacyl peptidase